MCIQDELVREYDMPFGFCIPDSVNTWQAEYDMPLYTDAQVQEFVRAPIVSCRKTDACLSAALHGLH